MTTQTYLWEGDFDVAAALDWQVHARRSRRAGSWHRPDVGLVRRAGNKGSDAHFPAGHRVQRGRRARRHLAVDHRDLR